MKYTVMYDCILPSSGISGSFALFIGGALALNGVFMCYVSTCHVQIPICVLGEAF
jgi:hypothetical protein